MERFFELIQVAIGGKCELSRVPTADEWSAIYSHCQRQALLGIGYVGIQRLPESQWPPSSLVIMWTMAAESIMRRNAVMNEACRKLRRNFSRDGFWSCILKGQSNRVNYPSVTLPDGNVADLGMYRTSGDIDVWVLPEKDCPNAVGKVIDYVCGVKPGRKVYYHHADFPVLDGIDVEVHYRPSFLYSPLRNVRLQRWFRAAYRNCMVEEYDGMRIPTCEFNMVFQLVHVYKHLFEDGIGLRQLLDYYFVIRNYSCSEHDTEAFVKELRRLGLRDFFSGLMYVLHVVFGMDCDMMPVKMNETDGDFLLGEIMRAGNFGHYDDRIAKNESTLERAVRKTRRNSRFICMYPEEVICEPAFRLYHFVWRCVRKFK